MIGAQAARRQMKSAGFVLVRGWPFACALTAGFGLEHRKTASSASGRRSIEAAVRGPGIASPLAQ